jgi:radical SAM superfamily enzyme YgiQ (UPF0313 family)
VLDRVRNFSPDIIGFSGIVSTAYKYIKDMGRIIKENLPLVKIIVGGSISAASDTILQNTVVDIVVKGEGEITVKELVSVLENSGDLNSVKGIAFRDTANEIITTIPREQIKNLDELPYPPYDMLDMKYYLIDTFEYIEHFTKNGYEEVDQRFYEPHRKGKKLMVIHTVRGCTHRCTFCQRHMKGIRLHSLDYLFNYVEFLMNKYNVGFFSFGAELFFPSKKYYWEFIEGIKKRRLDILFYITGARVNTVDKDILCALKETGCWMIEYGFESGSQKMLDIMEKGTTVEQNIQVACWTKDAGLFTVPSIILGMPGETVGTIRESINFLKKIDAGWHQFMVNYPLALPGSPLYDYAKVMGYITDDDKYLESVSNINASMLVIRGEKRDCFINYTEEPDNVVKNWQNLLTTEMEMHYIKTRMKGSFILKFIRIMILQRLKRIPRILYKEGLIEGLRYIYKRAAAKLYAIFEISGVKNNERRADDRHSNKKVLIPERKELNREGVEITRSVSLRKITKTIASGMGIDTAAFN